MIGIVLSGSWIANNSWSGSEGQSLAWSATSFVGDLREVGVSAACCPSTTQGLGRHWCGGGRGTGNASNR